MTNIISEDIQSWSAIQTIAGLVSNETYSVLFMYISMTSSDNTFLLPLKNILRHIITWKWIFISNTKGKKKLHLI